MVETISGADIYDGFCEQIKKYSDEIEKIELYGLRKKNNSKIN
jgi:phage replication-related protein YjqB (UPF0714/DUF867 family)